MDSYKDSERIRNGFRVDSYMEPYMDSEWIHNGFIHGLRMNSELIHAWIHTWVQNGLIHGFLHGFRKDSEWIHTWIQNGIRKKLLGLLAGIILCFVVFVFVRSCMSILYGVPEVREVSRNLPGARGFVVIECGSMASHGDPIQARN